MIPIIRGNSFNVVFINLNFSETDFFPKFSNQSFKEVKIAVVNLIKIIDKFKK